MQKIEFNNKKRLIVGMSGASGAVLGIEILKMLRENPEWESHLEISKGAEATINPETKGERKIRNRKANW